MLMIRVSVCAIVILKAWMGYRLWVKKKKKIIHLRTYVHMQTLCTEWEYFENCVRKKKIKKLKRSSSGKILNFVFIAFNIKKKKKMSEKQLV